MDYPHPGKPCADTPHASHLDFLTAVALKMRGEARPHHPFSHRLRGNSRHLEECGLLGTRFTVGRWKAAGSQMGKTGAINKPSRGPEAISISDISQRIR